MNDYQLSTLAIRAGQIRTHEGEHSEPIFTTSSYVFRNAAEAAARFAETEKGNIYSRFTNPTVRCFEERLAAMEGGAACVGTASGMAAILATCMALLKAGDHIVCSDSVFGSTIALINRYLVKFGVEVTYVRPDDNDAWRRAIRGNTRLFFLETPSNPLSMIADIRAIADIAHERGVLLAVDNCFCTPALQKPFELGADLVIHSATKYLDGQGRCVGGAVVGNAELVGTRRVRLHSLGRSEHESVQCMGVSQGARDAGAAHACAFECGARAGALARAATRHAQGALCRTRIASPASARRTPAGRLWRHRCLRSDNARAGAWAFIDATRLMSITANLGDVKTTITHPASTTHARITRRNAARRHHRRVVAHLGRSRKPRRSESGPATRRLAALGWAYAARR